MPKAAMWAVRILSIGLLMLLFAVVFLRHPDKDPNAYTHCGSSFDYDQYEACRKNQPVVR